MKAILLGICLCFWTTWSQAQTIGGVPVTDIQVEYIKVTAKTPVNS